MRRPAALGAGWLCCLALAACSAPTVGRPATPTTQTAAAPPVAVFLGDSYTTGFGDPTGTGYVERTARLEGWVAVPAGEIGTGYVVPGREAGLAPYADRVPDVVAAGPDVVVVQGSTNDVGQPSGLVRQAATALYAELAADLPEAEIVVLGPLSPPGIDALGVRNVRNELEQAAHAAGLSFIDPIAEGWLRPADGLYSDPIHPNEAGYTRLAEELVSALDRLGY